MSDLDLVHGRILESKSEQEVAEGQESATTPNWWTKIENKRKASIDYKLKGVEPIKFSEEEKENISQLFD